MIENEKRGPHSFRTKWEEVVTQYAQYSNPYNAYPLLSVPDACAALGGIGRSTLYGLIRDGRLASVKIGARRMIPPDAIAALLTNANA